VALTVGQNQPVALRAEAGRQRVLEVLFPLDLGLTLGPLRHGFGDPTIRFARGEVWRATRTPLGPASVRIVHAGPRVVATAWGAGAEAVLDSIPELLGMHDDPAAFRPADRRLANLHRRMPGLRIGRSGAVFEALLPAVIEQKVIGNEARKSYQSIVRRYGEPAPGPLGLRLAPAPSVLASVPYFDLHPLGIERRRAETIRRVAAVAPRLEQAARVPTDEGLALLQRVPGLGPWTAAEAVRAAGGDPDVVSIGDYHLPNVVGWALAGEPRADDARMLELLEPYRGQRGRVVRLLEAAGISAPRYGPRMALRSIANQ
jgi:3-methyladenine DNA glycosylase/8-oxoguanine DNA glycosylase